MYTDWSIQRTVKSKNYKKMLSAPIDAILLFQHFRAVWSRNDVNTMQQQQQKLECIKSRLYELLVYSFKTKHFTTMFHIYIHQFCFALKIHKFRLLICVCVFLFQQKYTLRQYIYTGSQSLKKKQHLELEWQKSYCLSRIWI